MNKLTLMTVLTLVSLQAKLCAQTDYEKRMTMSKTDQTFNNTTIIYPNVRDFVTLKEGKMIIELVENPGDYHALKNMDSLLTGFMRDIAFYKDSLSADPTAHYRIDYVLNDEYSFKKIRFKKYKSDGDIYMNRDGEIAKLKFDQDTVRLTIQRSMPGLGKGANGPCTVYYNAVVTFLVGNYYDVEKIVADKVLAGIIDTLQQASKPKKDNRFYIYMHPMTIIYNPYYSGKGRLKRHEGIMNSEYAMREPMNTFTINPQIGAALVRNSMTPIADIGIQHNKYFTKGSVRNIFRVSGTGYFFFDKDVKGDFVVNDNWFVNAAIGSVREKPISGGWIGHQADFGIGYLVSAKGNYFKNNTFRMFTDIMFVRGLTIVPEVIFTNDFKQIFPGITVKVL